MLGRLIRVQKFRADREAMLYVVAVPDGTAAIELLQQKLLRPNDECEDLGRVNDAIVASLNLLFGEFARI